MKSRTKIQKPAAALAAAALGFLVVPSVALGQDVEVKTGRTDEKARGPGEVTFDVVERPLKDVVAFIQDKTEVNLIISKDAEDIPITVKLRNLPWREALILIAEGWAEMIERRRQPREFARGSVQQAS